MSEQVKAALIVGAAIVLGVLIYAYTTPYRTCIRAAGKGETVEVVASCAVLLNEH